LQKRQALRNKGITFRNIKGGRLVIEQAKQGQDPDCASSLSCVFVSKSLAS
jgi:hypothetical protein